MKRGVVVIGLDGATFDVMDPLLDEGDLPFVGELVRNGAKARLLSTIPYATIPAWPSLTTGKNPGKHGVFDFFSLGRGERRISTSLDIRSPTLWEILSAYGKRSIVMNVPSTFPPAQIDGVVVSGMLTPRGAGFASPPEVKGFLDQVTGGYRINSRTDLSGSALVEDVRQVTEIQKTGFLALLRRHDWDFAMIVFSATDVIQHHFWDRQSIIRQCYQHLDGVVGEIAGAFPDAAVFLISDHGFQGQRKDFHINKWLIDQGYMCIRKGQGTEVSRWQEIGRLEGRGQLADSHLHRSSSYQFLVRLGLTGQKLRRFLPGACWDALKGLVPRSLSGHIPRSVDIAYEVDWGQTQASAYQLYSTENRSIKIMNVDQEARERICAELAQKLMDLRDPQTGDPIVRRAYRREELYMGRYVDEAPDLILDLRDGYYLTNDFFAQDYVTPQQHARGCHHREGIFVACGSDIRAGKRLNLDVSLLDVAPTVLHYLRMPVPDDCDGRVVKEIFVVDSETYEREPLHEKMEWKGRVPESQYYPDEEQAEIEERLKALGYL
jgi:predicted AlkP superfamily phosphohydrolase/phosphomutase